jgi:radical SAM protein with 4Fe4S-binding SPASM domain
MTGKNVLTIAIQNHALWNRLGTKRIPLSFNLEITARCNNNCRHCYINLPTNDRSAQARELSPAEISNLADEAVSLGTLWCLVTGGEPLLREDFPEIYLDLKRKGLLVSVFTNATLVHEEHIRLFKQYPPRDIELSVYGVTRETYERITRRSGSFDDFMRGLNLLSASSVKVRLKAVAMRSNVGELPAIARFCRERTKDYFRFDPFLHLRYDGHAGRNADIRTERLSPEEIVTIEEVDEERNNALRKGCSRLIGADLALADCNHLFHCGAGKGSFSISHDGFFRLCSDLCHPECVYDLRRGTLADAWRDFATKVRDLRSDRKEFLEKCHTCPIADLCFWCPARAHLETGEMDSPVDYFCRVAHARAEAFGIKKINQL